MTVKSTEIFKGIHHIGSLNKTVGLYPNIYLLIDGDDVVLFGSGPVPDFNDACSCLDEICGIEKISYIILQGHEPSQCASIPLFIKNGFSGKLVTHLLSAPFIQQYGIAGEPVYISKPDGSIELDSGRTIKFISTPYLKSAGSFVSFDGTSGILFSGDLFGAFMHDRSSYAGGDLITSMKKYHSGYMPDERILNYALGEIVKLKINMIAPQFGSVIREDAQEAACSLKDLRCGLIFRKVNTAHHAAVDSGLESPVADSSPLMQMKEKYERTAKEMQSLVETLRAIQKEYHLTDNMVFKDPLAQVYKEDMFRENLGQDIELFRDTGISFAFFIIEVDNLDELNTRYGRDTGDEILASAAFLLKNFKKTKKEYAHHLIFRMNGPRYVYYCTDIAREEIIDLAEAVRTEFRESRLFITDITVSIGLVHGTEFPAIEKNTAEMLPVVIDVAVSRLRIAKLRGTDSVCSESETVFRLENEKYILVVDPDPGVRFMIETGLAREGLRVVTCSMGDEALEKIYLQKPAIIISGVTVPKIDGFSLRKKLLDDSTLKEIPFIITSSIKDDRSVIRAQSLGIYHYFKKPYSMVELTGLVKNLSKSGL